VIILIHDAREHPSGSAPGRRRVRDTPSRHRRRKRRRRVGRGFAIHGWRTCRVSRGWRSRATREVLYSALGLGHNDGTGSADFTVTNNVMSEPDSGLNVFEGVYAYAVARPATAATSASTCRATTSTASAATARQTWPWTGRHHTAAHRGLQQLRPVGLQSFLRTRNTPSPNLTVDAYTFGTPDGHERSHVHRARRRLLMIMRTNPRRRDGEPFMGELRMMSFDFAPAAGRCATDSCCPSTRTRRCSRCRDTFGGDERVTFALPDLRNRVPIHEAQGLRAGATAARWRTPSRRASCRRHVHLVRASAANADLAVPWATSSRRPAALRRARWPDDPRPQRERLRRRRPAAHEHAALHQGELLHRPDRVFPSYS
jgi:hypothetical protein